jgi:hypothetical protein
LQGPIILKLNIEAVLALSLMVLLGRFLLLLGFLPVLFIVAFDLQHFLAR